MCSAICDDKLEAISQGWTDTLEFTQNSISGKEFSPAKQGTDAKAGNSPPNQET